MVTPKTKQLMVVGWKKYFNLTNPTINKYISKYGFKFIEQIYGKIKRAQTTKKPYIILIQFDNSDIVSVLYQNEYEYALKLLLQLCIKIEYYELCTDIQKSIDLINKRKRRIVGKKDKIPIPI
jgi:uncharacterized protein (DUF1330 family)